MISTKDHNNRPVTNIKDTETGGLPDREFKIAILRKLGELQENTERQLKEIRKTMHKQNEQFNKEMETI